MPNRITRIGFERDGKTTHPIGAEKNGIKNALLKRGKDFSENLARILPENTDLIVLAGFLSILSKDFCEGFPGKIINIHPALLPKFGGKGMWGHHVHEAVLNANEKESGATVHYVTSGIDEGEIYESKQMNYPKNPNYKILYTDDELKEYLEYEYEDDD